MAGRNSVLVVTPSPSDYDLIASSLAAEELELLPANCLLEAVLHQIASPDPYVVVYDTDSPEEWRQALRRFLSVRPQTRVVLVSRLADDQMWMDVLDGGGFDLVMKPFEPPEIRSVVRGAVAGRASSVVAA